MKKLRLITRHQLARQKRFVYEKIQQYLLSLHPKGLRFQNYDDNFLRQNYPDAFSLLTAIVQEGHGYFHKLNTVTHDPHNATVTCEDGKYRSSGDLFLIAWYYYPTLTYGEAFTHLEKLVEEERCGAMFCSDVKKRVYLKIESYRIMTFYDGYYNKATEWDRLIGGSLYLYRKEGLLKNLPPFVNPESVAARKRLSTAERVMDNMPA